MASGREAQPAPQGGGGPQHPFGSRISPAPFPPAAPAPPVVSPAPALSAGGADPPNCPTCLEPLRPADPPRQRPAFWPGCRYPYHFACLARTVARLPDPARSLCRAPWPEGAAPELVDACTALAVNPFLDSDAGSRPPTPRANAAHAAPAVPVDSSSGSDSDAPCPRSLFHNHFHGPAVARRSARSRAQRTRGSTCRSSGQLSATCQRTLLLRGALPRLLTTGGKPAAPNSQRPALFPLHGSRLPARCGRQTPFCCPGAPSMGRPAPGRAGRVPRGRRPGSLPPTLRRARRSLPRFRSAGAGRSGAAGASPSSTSPRSTTPFQFVRHS